MNTEEYLTELQRIKRSIHTCGMACDVDCTERLTYDTAQAVKDLLDLLVKERKEVDA